MDDLQTFARLCPDAPRGQNECFFEGVVICSWGERFAPVAADEVADVVIEAFACDPPLAYVQAMAERQPAPLWLNLEYLSAESWVDEVHGMVSPHPRLPLRKRFFFPGFSQRSGGLLRESGMFAERDVFCAKPANAKAFLAGLGARWGSEHGLRVSLFAYEPPALPALLGVWATGPVPVQLVVPQGRVVPQLARFFGRNALPTGSRCESGMLSVDVVPFVSQRDYDRLLWSCDLNLVRGEDSFVRAQWAAKPFVWQAYPQEGATHITKLEAFLARYLAGAGEPLGDRVRRFWRVWNGGGDPAEAWAGWFAAMPLLRHHAMRWAKQLASGPDLAAELVKLQEAYVK